MFKFFLAVSLFLFNAYLHAQQYYTSPCATLYFVKSAHIEEYFHQQDDEAFIATVTKALPIDTLCNRNSTELTLPSGQGAYVLIWAVNNELQWKLYFQHDMEYELIPVGNDVLIYLYNRYNLEPITDALIKKGDQVAVYEKGAQGYVIDFKRRENNKGIPVLIERNNQLLLTDIEKAKYPNQAFRRYWRMVRSYLTNPNFRQKRHYGYLALNKPKFRVGDTLKYKAYILDRKGRLAKNLGLELEYYDNVARKTVKKSVENLNHYRDGAYSGNFVVTDSLEGKFLKLRVTKSNHKIWRIDRSVEVEDYRIDEITFNSSVINDDNTFYANQPLVFEFSAIDDNGLPVLDGRVNIKITSRSVRRDSVFEQLQVPITFLDTTIMLDPIGTTVFKYYGPKVNPATFSLYARVKFQNSENEIHSDFFSLIYKSSHLSFKVKKEEAGFYLIPVDSINKGASDRARIKGFKRVHNEYGLYSISQDTLLFEKNAGYSHFEPFSAMVDYYVIEWNDKFIQRITKPYPYKAPGYGFTKEGKAFVYFYQSETYPVLYRIYDDSRKQILSGQAMGDSIFIKNEKDDYLVIEYQRFGESYLEREIFPLKEIYKDPLDRLRVDLNGPLRIRPGEKVTWDLKVAGEEGTVADLDIVGFSRKKNFDASGLAENLPYPQYKQKIHLGDNINLKSEVNHRWEQSVPLEKQAFYHLGLSTQPRYKYRFREEALIIDTFSIPEKTNYGQVAAFVYKGIQQQSLYYILANGKLIYAHNLPNTKFSFPLKPGTYDLELRGRDFSLTLTGITIFENIKTEVALNLEKLPDSVFKTDKPAFFTESEFALITAHTLFNETLGYPQYFAQNHNYSTVYKRSIGPFEKGEVEYWSPTVDSLKFYFEPGKAYHFSPHKVKVSDTVLRYQRNYLPFNVAGQMPGEVLLKKARMRNDDGLALFAENFPDTQGEQPNGTLYLWNNTDSSFIYYQVYHYQKDSLYFGKLNYRTSWPVGTYRLQAYAKNFHPLLLDSIRIAEKTTTYVWLEDYLFEDDVYQVQEPKKLQTGNTGNVLQGRVIFKSSGEAVPFANILVKSQGKVVAMGLSEKDGSYRVKNLPNGIYDLSVFKIGYAKKEYPKVRLGESGKPIILVLEIGSSQQALQEVTIIYTSPLIDKTSSTKSFSAEDIKELAVRGLSVELASAPGVQADNTYFVNGIKMGSKENIPQAAISSHEIITGGLPAQYGDAVGGLISSGKPNGPNDEEDSFPNPAKGKNLPSELQDYQGGLRTNFSDYAFFIPNITTDENGEAKISVQYPDDVNAWTTTFIGLGEGFKYFKAEVNTQSFSEVTSRLATPSYLRLGDSCVVIGKVLNYLDTALVVKSSFEVNGQKTMDSLRTVTTALIDNLPVKAKADSLRLKYTLELPGGYMDGEQRIIPVLPSGITFSKGGFIKANKDTLIEIFNPDKENYTITVLRSSGDVLLKLTEDLADYEYECNEQLASKLTGLLAQQVILEKHGERFRHKGQVERVIKKLLAAQNNRGFWGWWPNQPTDVFMTTYVYEALQQAIEADYSVPGLQYSLGTLENSLLNLKPYERVAQLYALHTLKRDVAFEYFMRNIIMDSLRISDKLKFAIVAESQKINYDTAAVEKLLQTDMLGNKYVLGEGAFSLRGSFYNTRLMAEWLLLKSRDSDLNLLRDYVLAQTNFQNLNTIEKAAVIRILSYGRRALSNGLALVELNGRTISDDGEPLSVAKSNKDSLRISIKTEEPVYISYTYEQFKRSPNAYIENYTIATNWLDKDEPVHHLPAGKTMTMQVKVDAAKKADYIMIKVPKPAGAVYLPKRRGLYQPYYFEEKRDHFNLYVNSMPQGISEFELDFNLRFKGNFILDPVKVELMYFPVFYGNNEVKRVVVQ